jgi:glycerol uptake facilitator protein
MLPIAGKGSSGWDYAAVPVIGPLIGAVLAGLAVSVLQI